MLLCCTAHHHMAMFSVIPNMLLLSSYNEFYLLNKQKPKSLHLQIKDEIQKMVCIGFSCQDFSSGE